MAEQEPLEAIIDRVAAADVAALRTLFERTSAKLNGIVIRIVGRTDIAEEVLQDIYLKAWQQAPQFDRSRGSPMTWLITIARNRAIDRRRADGRRPALDGDAALMVMADDAPTPEQQAETNSVSRTVGACIDELPADTRACIREAYWYGYSHSEIAERTGKPLGTVKSWVRRGLQQLKECLEA